MPKAPLYSTSVILVGTSTVVVDDDSMMSWD